MARMTVSRRKLFATGACVLAGAVALPGPERASAWHGSAYWPLISAGALIEGPISPKSASVYSSSAEQSMWREQGDAYSEPTFSFAPSGRSLDEVSG
jgi:hypothetical protein